MTVGELKQHLYELSEDGEINEDTEIRMAQQPRWAFEYSFRDIAVAVKPDDEDSTVLYLEEGHQIGYLPNEAAKALDWQHA
ncbi:hypothetical protein CL634_10650 [bacterium]|nr:hypothetical protein [bacterium]